MSNKNDPYNYASVYLKESTYGQKKLVDQDIDMESVAGSV